MKDLWDDGILLRILLIGILIALLGISPLPKAVQSGFAHARQAQRNSYPAGIADSLAIIAEQQPWRSGYWEAAGQAAMQAGDLQQAGNNFNRAAAKGELSAEGYLAWGDADWQLERYQTALQIWPIAAELGTPAEEILQREIDVYRATGDDLALISALKDYAQQPAVASGTHSEIGSLYEELGLLVATYFPASAPAYLSQAMEYDPTLELQLRPLNFAIQRALVQENPVYLLMVSGRALANLGRWDLAEKAFANAVELQPEYAEAWAYLGEAQQHAGAEVDPSLALETALKVDSESLSANTFMALYWRRQGNPEEALEYFQAALKLDPRNPALMVEIGNLVAVLGDLEGGQDYFLQAIEISPNDPRFVREFLKFSIQFNLNLSEVALPVARQLVLLNPEDPASLDVMGDVLQHLDDDLNAERFYLRALQFDPGYDQAHFHLGGLYRLQGKMGLAESHYHQALASTTNGQTTSLVQQALETYFSP